MRLLPRDESFFDEFDKQGLKTVEGCKAFVEMVEKPGDIQAQAKHISDIEHECDRITHAVVAKLHTTFITPIDRNDIHRLISKMDDVMDFVEAAAERLALYDIHEMTTEVADLARVLLASSERVAEAVQGFRDLKHPQKILDKCIEINRLENEADRAHQEAVSRLFDDEKDPLMVIKWKETLDFLEDATDRCEDVANVLEGVVVKNG
jgi:predicted phosphate transport protein (TIGR00153 family)